MPRVCPTAARWSFWERGCMHLLNLTANRNTPTSRAGKVLHRITYKQEVLSFVCFRSVCWISSDPLLNLPGLQSSSFDSQHCAPSVWSAWSICSSLNWLVTHLLTPFWWRCLRRLTSWLRGATVRLVRIRRTPGSSTRPSVLGHCFLLLGFA